MFQKDLWIELKYSNWVYVRYNRLFPSVTGLFYRWLSIFKALKCISFYISNQFNLNCHSIEIYGIFSGISNIETKRLLSRYFRAAARGPSRPNSNKTRLFHTARRLQSEWHPSPTERGYDELHYHNIHKRDTISPKTSSLLCHPRRWLSEQLENFTPEGPGALPASAETRTRTLTGRAGAPRPARGDCEHLGGVAGLRAPRLHPRHTDLRWRALRRASTWEMTACACRAGTSRPGSRWHPEWWQCWRPECTWWQSCQQLYLENKTSSLHGIPNPTRKQSHTFLRNSILKRCTFYNNKWKGDSPLFKMFRYLKHLKQKLRHGTLVFTVNYVMRTS